MNEQLEGAGRLQQKLGEMMGDVAPRLRVCTRAAGRAQQQAAYLSATSSGISR